MPNPKKALPTPETKNQREEMVAQGNDLIRHARMQLTAMEQNIIYYCISKVKPTDTDFMRQTFTITEFCDVCGIEAGGSEYRRIKAMVKSLSDKSKWVMFSNRRETLVRWFDTYDIDHETGTITAVLSQSIKPYILGLIERAKTGGEGYTQANLLTYLALQSKYGKRLYEILKSYLYTPGTLEKIYKQQIIEYGIDEFRSLLNAENYARYPDLRRKVIEVAEREINEVTDISIAHTIIRTGRKVTALQFVFQHKPSAERMTAYDMAKRRLGDTQR
jgi:plasmid replication initiation protein